MTRKLMLALFGIAILAYGRWIPVLVFWALMAEGRKNSQPGLALFLLWPLAELIWTWIRLARDPEGFVRVSPERRRFFFALIVFALLPQPFFLLRPEDDLFRVLIVVLPGCTILGCQAARFIWFRPGKEKTE